MKNAQLRRCHYRQYGPPRASFLARIVCYISFRFSSLCGVPGPELAMSQLLLSSLRRRRSPRSRIASRILKLTSSSPSLAESWLRGFSCWPDVPGNPPNELLRLLLRLRFRLGGAGSRKSQSSQGCGTIRFEGVVLGKPSPRRSSSCSPC